MQYITKLEINKSRDTTQYYEYLRKLAVPIKQTTEQHFIKIRKIFAKQIRKLPENGRWHVLAQENYITHAMEVLHLVDEHVFLRLGDLKTPQLFHDVVLRECNAVLGKIKKRTKKQNNFSKKSDQK